MPSRVWFHSQLLEWLYNQNNFHINNQDKHVGFSPPPAHPPPVNTGAYSLPHTASHTHNIFTSLLNSSCIPHLLLYIQLRSIVSDQSICLYHKTYYYMITSIDKIITLIFHHIVPTFTLRGGQGQPLIISRFVLFCFFYRFKANRPSPEPISSYKHRLAST